MGGPAFSTPISMFWQYLPVHQGSAQTGSCVAVHDLDGARGGVDAQFVAGAEEPRHVTRETVDQCHAGKGCTLCDDRVDPVEDQSPRHHRACGHVVQHPGSRDPTLRAVEDEDAVDIAPAAELMARAREDPAAAVEIVARAEIVSGDKCRAADRGSDATVTAQHDRQ